MKFDQLIECSIRNIFLQKSFIECGRETIPRFFPKKSKVSISLVQLPKVLYSFFIVCEAEDYRNELKLSCRPLAFTIYKAFLFLFLFKKEVWN